MSVDSFVFVRRDRIPTIEQWQVALDEIDTNIQLTNVGDLASHAGYIPVTYRGHASGFEWFYGTLADNFGNAPPVGLGDRGHVINFVTYSDMRELVCSMIAGAVLAQLADGLVRDEASGTLIDGDAALHIARGLELELQ